MFRKLIPLAALMAFVALGATTCGGDDEPAPAAPRPSPPPPPSASAPVAASPLAPSPGTGSGPSVGPVIEM